MSAQPPLSANAYYVTEVAKDDPHHTIHGFSPYSPVPVSPDGVHEAIVADDRDLATIQLAHYWLKTDCWIRQHNAEVEEAERLRKEVEDLRKVEEKKKAEIEEDRRRREQLRKVEEEREWRELEQWRREKGKGRAEEEMPEAGLSQSRKRRAESDGERLSSKRLKVNVPWCYNRD